jgi:uncharacterized membrane protein YczE
MERKITVPGEISLAGGILLISFAISLMISAGFGISTISSLPFALSSILDGMSFGIWNLIFQVCLLAILLAITRDFRLGYVMSFFMSAMFGIVIDLFSGVTSGLPTDIGFRLIYFVASYLIMIFAIALMVGSKIPLMIIDSFINDLTKHFHVTFRRLKTIFDIVCLAFSIVLSVAFLGDLAGVGMGTVIMALITGSGVHAANKVLNKVIVIKPWSRTLRDLAK